MSDMKLVRLMPPDKKAHLYMERYTVRGRRFIAGRWYQVPSYLAGYLRGVHSRPGNPDAADSVPCFNVCDSRAEAREVMARERRAKMEKQRARTKTRDLLSSDLRSDHVEVDIRFDDESDPIDQVQIPEDEHIETEAEKLARAARALKNAELAEERRRMEKEEAEEEQEASADGETPEEEEKAPAKKPKSKSKGKKKPKKETAYQKRKRLAKEAEEERKAQEELDAAKDHEGSGAEEPASVSLDDEDDPFE